MAMLKRIFLFSLVNILIVVTIGIVLQLLGIDPSRASTFRGQNYQSLFIFCLIYGFAGAFISLALSRIMAKWMMRVKVINPQNASAEEKELYQMVEILSRKANLPNIPEVGIYNSPELNAFATGPTKSRALVAVSTGLLHRMSKDEVEGVVGHEIAHIANGDMVTMTLLQGVINVFVMFFARIIAGVISANAKEESRPMIRFMTTIVLEIALGLLGMLVVAAFSRYREYRADQGGAMFAGRQKMIAALAKLKRNFEIPEEDSKGPESIAALKISGRKGGFLALLSTHPDLDDRIKRLQGRGL